MLDDSVLIDVPDEDLNDLTVSTDTATYEEDIEANDEPTGTETDQDLNTDLEEVRDDMFEEEDCTTIIQQTQQNRLLLISCSFSVTICQPHQQI